MSRAVPARLYNTRYNAGCNHFHTGAVSPGGPQHDLRGLGGLTIAIDVEVGQPCRRRATPFSRGYTAPTASNLAPAW